MRLPARLAPDVRAPTPLLLPLRLQEMATTPPARAYSVLAVPASALVGRWTPTSERVGPCSVRCAGLALACVLFSLAKEPWHLLAARVVQGAFSGVQPASYAMAGALRGERAHGAVYASMAFYGNVGRLLGPNLVMSTVALASLSTLFLALAAVAATAGWFTLRLPDARTRTEVVDAAAGSGHARTLRRRLLGMDVAACFFRGVVEQLFPVAVASFGLPLPTQARWLAWLYTAERATNLLSARAWGRRIDRHGYGASAAASLVLVAAASLAFAAAPSPVAFLLASSIFGVGGAGLHLAFVAGVVSHAAEAPATAIAWEASAARVGSMGGTATMGWLVAAAGLAGAYGVGAGACRLLAGTLRWWAARPAAHGNY